MTLSASNTEELLVEQQGYVAIITLNRPERLNAISRDMLNELSAKMVEADKDPDTRCIVLTGAGGAFCAGGDVKGFASGASGGGQLPSVEERIAGLRGGFEVSKLLHEIAKPTLAAIPGAAAGAGLSMALACD